MYTIELKVKSFLATIPSKILLPAIFIIAALSACSEKPLQADVYSAPIRANILKADKAVGFYQTKPLFYEITGEELKQLSPVFHIDEFHNSFSCICDAELILYFYKGEQLIQVLGIHPDKSLRWMESDWSGDAILSLRSQKRLKEWLSAVFDKLEPLPRGAFIAPELE